MFAFALRIGTRNLRRNKRRTLITSLSVAFGVCVAVVFIGMRRSTHDRLIDTGAKGGFGMLTISQPGFLSEPSAASRFAYRPLLASKLRSLPVHTQLVPRISTMAVVATSKNSTGAQILGVDPSRESKDVNLMLNWMHSGVPLAKGDAKGCVLGTQLAAHLGARLGDKVIFTVTDANGQIVSNLAYLRGTFKTGSPEVDGHLVMLPLSFLEQLLGYRGGEVSYLAVYAPIEMSLDKLTNRLQKKLSGASLQVYSWRQSLPDIAQAIDIDAALFHLLFLFAGAIICIGILNTMMLNIIERRREFGVMLALGLSPPSLVLMVMWEALLLGLIGLIVGGIAAAPLYMYLHYVGLDLSYFLGDSDHSVTFVDQVLGCRLTLRECLVIAASLLSMNICAAVYPALQAAWTVPIKAIRAP